MGIYFWSAFIIKRMFRNKCFSNSECVKEWIVTSNILNLKEKKTFITMILTQENKELLTKYSQPNRFNIYI